MILSPTPQIREFEPETSTVAWLDSTCPHTLFSTAELVDKADLKLFVVRLLEEMARTKVLQGHLEDSRQLRMF